MSQVFIFAEGSVRGVYVVNDETEEAAASRLSSFGDQRLCDIDNSGSAGWTVNELAILLSLHVTLFFKTQSHLS